MNDVDSASSLKILAMNSGHAIALYRTCIVTVWREQPTREAFNIRNEALLELSKKHPAGCACIEYVEPTSKAPPDDIRPLAVRVFGELGASLGCVAWVLEGGDLKSTLNRAVITGMSFIARQTQPGKVFRRTDQMATWVATTINEDKTQLEADLPRIIESMRGAMGK